MHAISSLAFSIDPLEARVVTTMFSLSLATPRKKVRREMDNDELIKDNIDMRIYGVLTI